MGDEYGGDAGLGLQFLELQAHLLAQRRVEVREGFVEEQHVGLVHQRAGEGDALLLAAGELRGIALPQAFEPHQPQGALHGPCDFGFGRLAHLQAEGDVVAHPQVRPQPVGLKHHAEVSLVRRHQHVFRRARDEPLADVDVAVIRGLEAGDDVQGGRLAAAAGSQQGQQLALGHLEGNPVDGDHLAESLDQFLDPYVLHQVRPSTSVCFVSQRTSATEPSDRITMMSERMHTCEKSPSS